MHSSHCLLRILLLFCISFSLTAQIGDGNAITLPELDNNNPEEYKQILQAKKLVNNGNIKEGIRIARTLLKNGNHLSKANACLIIANYFNRKAMIDSSLVYANRSLTYDNIKNVAIKKEIQAIAYNQIAVTYNKKGLYDESKKWHLKGIEISDGFTRNKIIHYTHLFGLANVYLSTRDYENALDLFKKCLGFTSNPEMVRGSYVNIATIYGSLGQMNTSLEYLEKARTLCKRKKDVDCQMALAVNIGVNYKKLGKSELAIAQFKEAIRIADLSQSPSNKIEARMIIAGTLIDLKEYSEAEYMLALCQDSAVKLGLLETQANIYNYLQRLYEAQKKYEKAYYSSLNRLAIKDTISLLQKNEELNELEVKYQTLQKVKEIDILQSENTNKKLAIKNQEEAFKNLSLQKQIIEKQNENKILSLNSASEKRKTEIVLLKKDQEVQQANLERQKSIKNIILISFVILLIPVIGMLIIYYQKLQTQSELNKKQKEIGAQKINALLQDQELKLIKAAVEGQDKERGRIAQELHDGIGGNLAAIKLQLNAVTTQVQSESLSTINMQIDDTYEQVRDLSHNLIPKKFSKNNFCDVLEEYINNIGEASSIDVSFIPYPRAEVDTIEENIQMEIFKIIQELITNTIKHAKASSIELQLNVFDDTLSVLFEDNGVGFDTSKNAEGIGFENMKNRLQKIAGTVHVDSMINRGTIIDISIPTV